MNKKALILTALGGVALVEYQRYSRLIDTFSLSASDFKIKVSGGNLVVNFNLLFINNSDKSLKISKIRGLVKYAGTIVGRFNSNQKAVCKSDATTKIPITATLFPTSAIESLVSGNAKNIDVVSYTNIGFDLLGVIAIPITISDVTTFKTDGFISDVIKYVKAWNENRSKQVKQ